MEFEPANAYWLDPGGKLRQAKTTHIEDVGKNPEEFGLTSKIVNDYYKMYREKPYIEGRARDEIIDLILKRGWTRIRYVISQDYYDIQTGELAKRVKDYLFQWAVKTLEQYTNRNDSRVVINVVSSRSNQQFKMSDLVSEALLNMKEQAEPTDNFLIPIRGGVSFLNTATQVAFQRRLKDM